MLSTIQAKVAAGERIDRAEAAWLFSECPDDALRALGTAVKSRFHAPDSGTYLKMAIVNYTNVCVARCDYCAFFRFPGDADTYVLSFDQVCAKIDQLRELDGTMVGFNGGFNPDLPLEHYTDLFQRVRARYPDMTFYEMTVAEFMFVAKRGKHSYAEAAKAFADCGTRWITGGGAEILTNSFRMRHSPAKYEAEDYYAAQRAVLDAGMGSTATMVIGFDETLDERMEHLETLRAFQDSVDGRLSSFLCWTFKPYNTVAGGEEISLNEYLRWLAVCRIYLDNITHIRTSVLTRNADALLGLAYGANDFDLPTEDEVTQKAGATISHEFDAVLQGARDRGLTPTLRGPLPAWNLG